MRFRLVPTLHLLVAAAALAVVTACGASDPPVRSPLADPGEDGTAVTGIPTALPTFPSPFAPATPGTGVADDERLAGAAIDALAEWLGVPASTFTRVAVDPVTWPNACIGVERPSFACAEVVTPGARVTLVTFGEAATYYVHADQEGRLAWAPMLDAEREVERVDVTAGRITLRPFVGADEMGVELAVVPGSWLDRPLAEIAPGARVHVAVAPALQPDAGVAPVVWLVVIED